MPASLYYQFLRSLLFALPPEVAHKVTLSALQGAACLKMMRASESLLSERCQLMGLFFPNPVGLAAGLDKDGAYIDGLAALGFGCIEIGTVTPRPQPGNLCPRLFRLPKDQALINRMGFNNGGVEALIANVQASKFYQARQGVLGINIGKNKDTPLERAIDDYLFCLERVYPFADYVTINISSPNTKDLRQLQQKSELDALLSKLKQAQKNLADKYARQVPLALKLAPDLEQEQIKNIAGLLLSHQIEAVIATNTTVTRPHLMDSRNAAQEGGLSGKPLAAASNRVIRLLKAELADAVTIIGVGGIFSGQDAQQKIEAGASLVQLYTGLIYQGPALVKNCQLALRACLESPEKP